MLTIAFYNDEKDNEPASVEVSWTELTKMLTADTPSGCTSATCVGKKCPFKSNSTDDEEAGAWSPVVIRDRRLNENVEAVTALVLDGDGITSEQLDQVAARVQGLSFIVHTTHRHRPGSANFIRLILQLSRPIKAAEWARFWPSAISYLGFDGIFDQLKDLSRLYFFPTHPSDVQFLSDFAEGDALDVDAILSAQSKVIPTSAAPAEEFEPSNDAVQAKFADFGAIIAQLQSYRRSRAQGDTKKKEQSGLIGALLDGKPLAAPGGNANPTPVEPPGDLPKGRGYAIMRTMAILTGYLSPDTPDDIYLDLFRSSITAMCFGREADRAEMEQQVLDKLYLGRIKRTTYDQQALERNTAAKSFMEAAVMERKKLAAAGIGQSDDWLTQLQYAKEEKLINSAFNVYTVLKNESEIAGHIRWDDVNLQIVTTGMFKGVELEVLPEKTANYLSKKWGLNFNNANIVHRQILLVAYENRFDPIQDYLFGLIWDGIPRLDTWLSVYANVEDTAFTRKAGRKWMVGSAARALNPGCKHDCVLMLEGAQGKRKSTLFRILGGEHYAAVSLTVADKDSKMIAARSWISELPDLAALKKVSEQNALKAFFTIEEDKFRPPFGRAVITSKRRNSFAGTTNEDDYLIDPTGNRRYLTVKCNALIDITAVVRDRDQLWAEAVYLYNQHVSQCQDKLNCGCWWFPDDQSQEIEEEADQRVQESPFKVGILEWWESLSPERRPKEVTTLYLAKTALDYSVDKITNGILTHIGIAARALGFVKKRKPKDASGQRSWIYEASTVLMNLPQVDRGKVMAFKVVKGGIDDPKKAEAVN